MTKKIKEKAKDHIIRCATSGGNDLVSNLGATATATATLSFNSTATGVSNVINSWDKNVSYSGGNTWVQKVPYSPQEIKFYFSTSSSHKRKFKVDEIFRHGVYILYRKNVVVYVGESMNPYSRICSHKKSDKDFDCFRILYCKESRKKYWEKKLINGYVPEYNKTNKKTPTRRLILVNPKVRRI
ncbi:MAG: hypothetical protein GOVbin3762_25 [Prokaryotic dsDNA virus sp.]|nr:MAG: hypothetical protein GOVbin3762_25 [Prokaryotic dsDNA virus sp.]